MKLKALITVGMCGALSTLAFSHSWYPLECCSNHDCAPLIGKPEVLSNWEFRYTTNLSSGITDQSTKLKDSPDNQTHVCIREGKVICLFFPPIQ